MIDWNGDGNPWDAGDMAMNLAMGGSAFNAFDNSNSGGGGKGPSGPPPTWREILWFLGLVALVAAGIGGLAYGLSLLI